MKKKDIIKCFKEYVDQLEDDVEYDSLTINLKQTYIRFVGYAEKKNKDGNIEAYSYMDCSIDEVDDEIANDFIDKLSHMNLKGKWDKERDKACIISPKFKKSALEILKRNNVEAIISSIKD